MYRDPLAGPMATVPVLWACLDETRMSAEGNVNGLSSVTDE